MRADGAATTQQPNRSADAPTGQGTFIGAQELASLVKRLTEAANASVSLDDVVQEAARDIAGTLGWAHSESGAVLDGSLRSPQGSGAVTALGSGSEARDAVASAVATGTPATRTLGPQAGGGCLVAVPVVIDGATDRAMLFATNGGQAPSAAILDVLHGVGWQLGLLGARQAAWEAIQRSNAELERFAYVASHDLQEPLRKVVTACDLLERRYGHLFADDPDAELYMGIAVDAARRMQTLIRDLLAYSRLGRGDQQPSAVSLDEVVSEVCRHLDDEIAEAGATIVVDPLPTVWSTPQELHHVMSNLISNAIKFRASHPPEVRIAAAPPVSGMVEITVTDNGIGVDPDRLDQVFEVFRRLHRQDQFAGTGVGLAIVKRVIEQHGGHAWITLPDDGGSCVHVTLPEGDAP